ncbi:MAG: transketolase C-terminal domain-containing protein, partial [Anaerolineaceae bacterium]|nr:transketolase C-terminal domain-containing protein [Anaerolineaceae bacterium]
RYVDYYLDDARLVVVGFGSSGRIALSAVRAARAEGIPVGLIRPISVSPFPSKVIEEISQHVDRFLVVEMNAGQMLDDVLLAVKDNAAVDFYGRMGGVTPYTEEILDEIRRLAKEPLSPGGNPRQRWLKRMTTLNL